MSEEKSYRLIYQETMGHVTGRPPEVEQLHKLALEAVAAEAIRRHESSLLKVVEEMEIDLLKIRDLCQVTNSTFEHQSFSATSIAQETLSRLKKWREENV